MTLGKTKGNMNYIINSLRDEQENAEAVQECRIPPKNAKAVLQFPKEWRTPLLECSRLFYSIS